MRQALLAMSHRHRSFLTSLRKRVESKAHVLSTGSAGTYGMVAGFHALGCDIPIMGISVRQPEKIQIDNVYRLAVKQLPAD